MTFSKIPETKCIERHSAVCFYFVSYSRDIFCALSRLFVRPGFRLFCARLDVDYLTVCEPENQRPTKDP